jgi:iron(III) transport system ATP-binding protein
MSILEVIDIGKKREQDWVLHHINFDVQKGQFIGLAGETGSGKTTLLKTIAGLLQADAGKVIYNGVKLKGPEEKLMPGHPEISFLSQHFELLNNYTVQEFFEIKRKVSLDKANAIYAGCKIDHLLNRKTNSISGGERQRIALASELIKNPSVLLLDEPFSNLDAHHKTLIKDFLKEQSAKLGLTILMVSHDARDILSWADFVLVLKNGTILEKGSPGQISAFPKHKYTETLLGVDRNSPLLNWARSILSKLGAKFFF